MPLCLRMLRMMAGLPSLEEKLATPELQSFSQRLAARCYLAPLTRAETEQYVRAQLAASHEEADRLVVPQAYEAIFANSDGVLRVVNQLCDRALVLADARGLERIDAAIIEAAWADETVRQAAEMARLGGRVVLVGIPRADELVMKHSTARRKGLTIALSRRMKHCYPRAIRLAEQGRVDLHGLVSHRFPLKRAAEAFKLNAAYGDKVVKVIIKS